MFSLEKAMLRFNEAQEAPLSNLKHFFSKNLSLCNLQKSYQYIGFDDTKTGISVVDPLNYFTLYLDTYPCKLIHQRHS